MSEIQPGDQFGKWVVLETGLYRYEGRNRTKAVLVRCECGFEAERSIRPLLRGGSTQCLECLGRENTAKALLRRYQTTQA